MVPEDVKWGLRCSIRDEMGEDAKSRHGNLGKYYEYTYTHVYEGTYVHACIYLYRVYVWRVYTCTSDTSVCARACHELRTGCINSRTTTSTRTPVS